MDSYKEAAKTARKRRDRHCEFDGGECWDDVEDDEPPWDSADLLNYDNDEEVIIDVMTVKESKEDKKEKRLYVERENLRIKFEAKVKKGIQAERPTGVFYADPAQRSDADVPAELEISDTFKLKYIEMDLATLKSLLFEGGKEHWVSSLKHWNSGKEGTPPPDLLLEILPQCISLQELHLNKTCHDGDLTSGYIERILVVAPYLLAQTASKGPVYPAR